MNILRKIYWEGVIQIAEPTKAKVCTLTTPDGTEQLLPRTKDTAVEGIYDYAKIVYVDQEIAKLRAEIVALRNNMSPTV